MTHLKHSGPVRIAAHAKRTALVEILSDEQAANDGDLTEQDLAEIDLTFRAIEASANAEARAIVQGVQR
jgi:hypothetical protein